VYFFFGGHHLVVRKVTDAADVEHKMTFSRSFPANAAKVRKIPEGMRCLR